MAPREICLLLVLDVIELLEDRELDLSAAADELALRAAADGRPMDAPVAGWVVEIVQRARDDHGLDPQTAASALHFEGLEKL